MILICEECGKKYQTKGTLKKNKVRFKCRACSHVITITKADVLVNGQEEAPVSDFQSVFIDDPKDETDQLGMEGDALVDSSHDPVTDAGADETTSVSSEVTGRLGLGHRAKMMLLFLVISILLFVAAGAYYLVQMEKFSMTLTTESTQVVRKVAEDNIKASARLIANQCKHYLLDHPDLTEDQFINDPIFSKIGTQPVGLTGYTALYSVGPFTTWTHVNKKILGKPLLPIIKKPLGDQYDRFYNIIKKAEEGENIENAGYYLWQDADGILREKYMAVAPVDGTKFGIAATVYLPELMRDINMVENKAQKSSQTVRNIILAILGLTLLVMAIIVFFYAHRITERIQNLTNVAERISVGEMDAKFEIETNDEIGTLGEAIGRMQESIRLSIERLRKRY